MNTVHHGTLRWSIVGFSAAKKTFRRVIPLSKGTKARANKGQIVSLPFTSEKPPGYSEIIRPCDEPTFWLQPLCAKSTPRNKLNSELARRSNCAGWWKKITTNHFLGLTTSPQKEGTVVPLTSQTRLGSQIQATSSTRSLDCISISHAFLWQHQKLERAMTLLNTAYKWAQIAFYSSFPEGCNETSLFSQYFPPWPLLKTVKVKIFNFLKG